MPTPLDLSAIDAPAPPSAFYYDKAVEPSSPAEPVGGKGRGLNPILTFGPALAGLADAYTTRQNIRAGASEGDPLMRPFAYSNAIYPVEVGAGLLAGLGGGALAKKGHRTAGTILSGAVLIPMASGAILNLLRGKDHRAATAPATSRGWMEERMRNGW